MEVLVDTCIWSATLRRSRPDATLVAVVDDLLVHAKASLIGAIRQEVLSGLADSNQYARLRSLLRAIPDISPTIEDFEVAASFFNRCRSKGIQGSHIDLLICAVAHRKKLRIFTSDHDFDLYATVIPVRRFKP